ncbi:MAG: Eco57I restriction-modification methylase domain-containing protein [Aquificaceae bacterium]
MAGVDEIKVLEDVLSDLELLKGRVQKGRVHLFGMRSLFPEELSFKSEVIRNYFMNLMLVGSKPEAALSQAFLFLMEELGFKLAPETKRKAGAGVGYADWTLRSEITGRVVDIELKAFLGRSGKRLVYTPLEFRIDHEQLERYLLSDASFVLVTNLYEYQLYSKNSFAKAYDEGRVKPISRGVFIKDILMDVVKRRGFLNVEALISRFMELEERHPVFSLPEFTERFLRTLGVYYGELDKTGIDTHIGHKLVITLILARALEDFHVIPRGQAREELERLKNFHGGNADKIVRGFFRQYVLEVLYDYYDTDVFYWAEEELSLLYNKSAQVLDFLEFMLGLKRTDLFSHGLYTYDFYTIDEDVLGKSYEEFLESPVKKKEGVVYTPANVVSYMVRRVCEKLFSGLLDSLRKALSERDWSSAEAVIEEWIGKKILDPACGSGGFLVKALREIFRFYEKAYRYFQSEIDGVKGTSGLFVEREDGEVLKKLVELQERLIPADPYEYFKALCERHLYGVDIDERAIRIAKLNLWKEILRIAGKAERFKGRYDLSKIRDNRTRNVFPVLERNFWCADAVSSAIEDWHNQFGFLFDAVIGNPPYIRHKNLSQDYKQRLSEVYGSLFDSTQDIYCYFFYRGLELLKDGGYLAYITSNKWFRAEYGRNLRLLLKDYQVLELIDLAGLKVFHGVSVDPAITILRKTPPEESHKVRILKAGQEEDIEDLHRAMEEKGFRQEQSEVFTEHTVLLEDDRVLALKGKIESKGKPLKEWDVKIYRGVLTGFNEAFIIDTATREKILANCKDEEERKRTEQIIKPVLRGRDIGRYYYKWAGLWLIGTFPVLKLDIENYPALKKYFLENFDIRQLEQSGKKYPELGFNARKKTSNKWFETQDNIAYYPEFEKEKVVWQRVSSSQKFTLVEPGIYCEATTHFITGKNLLYLLGILNSKVFGFAFYRFYMGGGIEGEIKGEFIGRFPIPPITDQNKPIVQKIEDLVSQILQIKEQDPSADTTKLEKQVDQLVYELYELTEEEIELIEGVGAVEVEEKETEELEEEEFEQ